MRCRSEVRVSRASHARLFRVLVPDVLFGVSRELNNSV